MLSFRSLRLCPVVDVPLHAISDTDGCGTTRRIESLGDLKVFVLQVRLCHKEGFTRQKLMRAFDCRWSAASDMPCRRNDARA
jgi:hypothetical protein